MSDRKRFLTTWDGPVTALTAWRATADERERALETFRCSRIVRDLQRDGAHADLVTLFELATRTALHAPPNLDDHRVLAAIESAITNHRLLLIPGWDLGHQEERARPRAADGARETEQERLVKSAMGDRTAIELEGRRYRFVAADGSSRQPGGGRAYIPVPETLARELVTRLAERLAKTPDERASWQRLADKLTDRRGGAGILLMRYVPPSGGSDAPSTDAPATTPSQTRAKVAEKAWVEIEIVYEDGSPFDGSCVVELPGGRRSEGAPDQDGVVRLEGIDPGTCKVSFPALDGPAWDSG